MKLLARSIARVLGAAIVATTASGGAPHDAEACGTLRSSGSAQAPSLVVEQVLIVWDRPKHREHFVRQVVFRGDSGRFGFVVPTPTVPEVAAAPGFSFTGLELDHPFDEETSVLPFSGAGRLGGSRSVEVLERKKVGSFTAFVLAATDSRALAKWMKDNDLASDDAMDAWLEHYVRAGFHFVALRFEPPKGAKRPSSELRAETLRVSFDTPAPYYPYFEPARPADADRVLALWLVSPEPLIPIALERRGSTRAWVRPFAEGPAYVPDRERLARRLTVGETALLPEGEVGVQTFEDQKRSRDGFGDVVFVPKTPHALDATERRALGPLLSVLDPELGSER